MQITGAELIARSLVACGLTHVFNVPGLGIHPLLEAIRQHRAELNYFTAPSETAVTLMADGYGRATGMPAFVNVYHASGTALGMMGVTTAWADRSPMVFTTTTSSRRLERRDQYASVPGDITDVTRQFVKWNWEVPLVERIPEALARAVLIAKATPPGPVHLAFPMDLYTDTLDASVAQRLLDELRGKMLSAEPGSAHPDALGEACTRLESASRPLIVAGGQVAQSGDWRDLVDLAERLEAAVLIEPYVAFMGFPNDHRLFAGRFSVNHPLVREADLIIFAGAELTEGGGTVSFVHSADTQLVAIAADARDIGKQLWPHVALVGNPSAIIVDLRDWLTANRKRPEWTSRIATVRESYQAGLHEEVKRTSGNVPISIARLATDVQDVFGDRALIVDHSTTGTAYLLQMYRFSDPSRYFGISARASAQGWGAPAAIGVQIGRPKERVVAFVGDGGLMFTGSALYAAALWRLPIVFIVLSNGGWYDVAYGAQVKRGWTEEDLRNFGWRLDPPIDHASFAASLGISSERVSAPTDLRPALERASQRAGPTMLVVDTDPKAVEYYLDWIQR